MKKISTKKNVRFFDDRSKTSGHVYMQKIFWEDENYCLCDVSKAAEDGGEDPVLFNKTNGEVLTLNFEFWYAENYKNA